MDDADDDYDNADDKGENDDVFKGRRVSRDQGHQAESLEGVDSAREREKVSHVMMMMTMVMMMIMMVLIMMMIVKIKCSNCSRNSVLFAIFT